MTHNELMVGQSLQTMYTFEVTGIGVAHILIAVFYVDVNSLMVRKHQCEPHTEVNI